MKNFLKIIFFIVFLCFVPKIYSQSVLKVGHVNVSEILSGLPATDSAKALLEKDAKALNQMLENMQVEYNKMTDDFIKNENTYSDLVKKEKQSQIMEMQEKITNFQENASDQLQQRNNELLQPIYQKIQDAINKVATNGKFTYILDVSQGTVVFTSTDSENIDLLVMNELK